jgi:hypothetical protein
MNENHEMMADGKVDINDPQVLAALNTELTEVTSANTQTPYIAWVKVQKVLALYHIHIPNGFLEGTDGNEVIPLNQFGKISGQTNDGQITTNTEVSLFLYFEWLMDEDGSFSIFAEVVDEKDLKEILADYDNETGEQEMNEERSEKRNAELMKTRLNILKKVGKKIDDKDPHLAHPKGYAKRGLGTVKKIDKALSEEETINELTREKINDYVSKSSKQTKELMGKKGRSYDEIRKTVRRVKGTNLAKKKLGLSAKVLAKEETINEVSKKTLKSYIKKATQDVTTGKNIPGRNGFLKPSKRIKNITKAVDKLEESNEPFDGPYVQKGKEKSNPNRRAATIADKAMKAVKKKLRKKPAGFTRKELQARYDSLEYKGD